MSRIVGWTDNSGSVRPLCSFTVPEFDGNSYRITSLSYSPDGQDVLVSYSSDHLYLFSMKVFISLIEICSKLYQVKSRDKTLTLLSRF